jgi:legumain
VLVLCLTLLGTSQAASSRLTQKLLSWLTPTKFAGRPEEFTGDVWAVLIAGSSGWGNYRHQADVCHAYQVLKHGGLDDDHIVVMMADDIASNYLNPHPGQIFNNPKGPDVYDGVPVDYRGEQVNAENFLAVLAGEQPQVIGSSGKTIKSGPKDRVFVFFADHGAPGVLGMPSGPFLYADDLLKTLRKAATKKRFADMVMYIEACESGSIFEGMLTDDEKIYVTTAANAHESSWGTYCPGMLPSPPPEFTTCLGDLYSVSWMENSEHANLVEETLEKQYELVKLRTSNNNTYNQGSHVMQYGNLTIDEEPAADYLGFLNTGDGTVNGLGAEQQYANGGMGAVPQREADLLHLYTMVQRADSPAAKVQALEALHAETDKRLRIDKGIRNAVGQLLRRPAVLASFQATYAAEPAVLAALPSNEVLDRPLLKDQLPITEQIVTVALPRTIGRPVVDDWDCLKAMVSTWESACGQLDQYGMQHTRTFANLCNAGVNPDQLLDTAISTCGGLIANA